MAKQARKASKALATVQRISGPRSRYRHKVRSPISLLFTQPGHERMQQELQRTGLSRSDYFEDLMMFATDSAFVKKHGHLVKRVEAGEMDAAAATGT